MLTKLDQSSFEAIYSIMTKAFPYSEYRDKAAQRALFAQSQYEVYGWLIDQHLIAFLAIWDLGEIRFGEHLAVLESHRNQGIGAKLFQAYEALDHHPLIFEVELPETSLAKRRIAFYERMGFTYYGDMPYYQGAFHNEQTPLPLRLMMNISNANQAQLNHYIDLIYENVYHAKRWF